MAEAATGSVPGALLGPGGSGRGSGLDLGTVPGPCSVPCHLRGLGVRALVGGLDEHGLGDVLARGHCHLLDLVQLLSICELAELLLPLLHLRLRYLLCIGCKRLDLPLDYLGA